MGAEQRAFAGATAIVTGGASGIGRALGAELLARGAHVVLADVDEGAALDTADELAGASPVTTGSITAAGIDVRDEAAIGALVDATASEHGRLDFMFNNAGISMGGRTHEMQGVHWERMVAVNLNGVINGVLAAYPVMIAQGGGHIVNTASAAGLAPAVLTVAYSTTKHAVVGLSTSLRPEAAAHGVRVSVLCPGGIETPILDKHQPADLPPRGSDSVTARDYFAKIGVKPMPADRFAQRALRGVARNRAIIVVPRSIKALWYLQRMSPGLVERVGRRTARRVLYDTPT